MENNLKCPKCGSTELFTAAPPGLISLLTLYGCCECDYQFEEPSEINWAICDF